MLSVKLLVGLMAGLVGVAAADQRFQDLDELDAQVAAAVGDAGAPVPVDRRIKLANCPQAPEISQIANGAVVVRCAAIGWRIRVPVEAAAGLSAETASQIVVRKGDSVELLVQGRGYSASAIGTSLDEGGEGTRVRVKIPTSPVPLPAVVVRAGVVSISG